jgi:hypothetical protein
MSLGEGFRMLGLCLFVTQNATLPYNALLAAKTPKKRGSYTGSMARGSIESPALQAPWCHLCDAALGRYPRNLCQRVAAPGAHAAEMLQVFQQAKRRKGCICFRGLASSLPDRQDPKSPYSSVHGQDRTSFHPSQHSRMEGSSAHEAKDGDTGSKSRANLDFLSSAHLFPGVA